MSEILMKSEGVRLINIFINRVADLKVEARLTRELYEKVTSPDEDLSEVIERVRKTQEKHGAN